MKKAFVFDGTPEDLIKFLKEPAAAPFDSVLDTQEGGDHYKKMGQYQPWEVSAAWLTPEELKGAMKFTVITYLAREADKGGMEDIRKAAHTMQIYLELAARAEAKKVADGEDPGGCCGGCEGCSEAENEPKKPREWMNYDPVDGSPFFLGPRFPEQYRAYNGVIAWLYNPWTGKPRDPRDIGTDPTGLLMDPPVEVERPA